MLKLGLCQPDAEFEWLRGSGTKKNQAVLLAIGIQVQGLILGSKFLVEVSENWR